VDILILSKLFCFVWGPLPLIVQRVQGNGEPLNGQLYYVYIYDYPLTQIQRSKIEL
jgi:hypothetical protein